MDEVEAAERQEDLTAREQCRSELVEDDDDYTQTDDLEDGKCTMIMTVLTLMFDIT